MTIHHKPLGPLFVVLLSVLTVSCAIEATSAETTTGADSTYLDTIVGRDVADLVSAWGAPTMRQELADGRREYLFIDEQREDQLVLPRRPRGRFDSVAAAGQTETLGGGLVFSCEIKVITDFDGMVLSWQTQGDGCERQSSTD
jgi:hypothetical protein